MGPRVLIVAPRLDVGGAEMHLTRILPELRRQGLDVSVFVMARGGRLESKLTERGVPVSGMQPFTASRAIRSLRGWFALRRELQKQKPDIVHFFLPEAYLVGAAASLGLPGLTRIMSRRSLALYQRNHPLLASVERRVHQSMAALLGNSSAVVAELIGEGAAGDKVGLIHNGIDLPPLPSPERRAAIRDELGIPDDAFVIAVIANLIPYKGHDDLLEGLGRVRDRLREPWRLILTGRDEGIGDKLRDKAETLGIGRNILWLDERADAQAPLEAADLAVLPSHEEGFSNSLLEKMARGLPVVATRIGGNIDAVVDGETGRLVPIKDPQALGEAIVGLYEDAAMRARFGAAARARVEQLFSLSACVRRYLNLYRGIRGAGVTPIVQIIDPPIASGAHIVHTPSAA
jgi:glycosyltransferase involved in cell wall biosynthesis